MNIFNELDSIKNIGSIPVNSVIKHDCIEAMQLIPDNSIDMILCDLPYGTTKCKWDVIIPFDDLWRCYKRIIKENGAILLFAQTPFDKVLGCSNLPMLRYEWIWEKTQATGHQNAKKMPMKAHENILVFYKKLPTYNPIKTTGHVRKVSSAKNRMICAERTNAKDSYLYGKDNLDNIVGYDSTERYPRSVLKYKTDKQKNPLHETQKPLELCKYLIKTYTNEGDLVLDNCCGSGTTGLAAKETNRNFILIENDEKHFNTTVNRLK